MADKKVDPSCDTLTWPLPQKEVPISKGASDSFQCFLENVEVIPGEAKVKEVGKSFRWEILQRITDRKNEQLALHYAKELKVTIEEDFVNGVHIYEVTPSSIDTGFENVLFLHIHGGAYVFGKGISGTLEAVKLAALLQIKVVSIDYRLAPQHPAPAALNDVLEVYSAYRNQFESLFMGGSSAGGALTLSAVQALIKGNKTLPNALFVGTPWADINKNGDSYWINAQFDHQLVAYEGFLKGAAEIYADQMDKESPMISPIYGNFTDFPPTFLASGTRDLFLSNTVRTDVALKKENVHTELLILEGIGHEDYLQVDVRDENDECVQLEECQFFSQRLSLFLKQFSLDAEQKDQPEAHLNQD